MADLSSGSSWGSFRIERLVDRGPTGTVYRATLGEKTVALKILHDSLGEAVLARFEDDTRRLVGLNHPNILRVESVGREGGRRYFVTEAFDGRLVRSVHEPEDLMPAARALAAEIAEHAAPVSVALTRRMLWRMLGAGHPMEAHRADSRAILLRGASEDAREGVTSFLEKRPAEFTDRVSDGLPDVFPGREEPAFE